MRKLAHSFFEAVSMYTILPAPHGDWEDGRVKYIMAFLPLVGFLIGLLWVLVYAVSAKLHIPVMLRAFIISIFPFFISGFLHIDGFMDTCDALFSRRDLDERLRILRDSHVGSFAVTSIIMLMLCNFSSAHGVITLSKDYFMLIIIPIISRSGGAVFLLKAKPLKGSSMGAFFKEKSHENTVLFIIISIILCCILSLIFFGIKGLILSFALLFAVIFTAYGLNKSFGGFSGDLTGFSISVCETLGLFLLAVL
ncbi:adenosylcobinamide-GDP ribazoletransferase [Anaeropeptidivorans aminofermentans]|jgi:adenosylcobinamide-GDP ribazoletransferase|uniref:adenosylcobinamide-GDP ribazoletransferase n=1 Tax=Anaeropeptidivorans aminofermentans TaxID=2934315 RepID=UPI002023F358|nr:adenosylcobinamide-GDP ribazoletransferase [Anaeropeptidivorans aminofermentans]